MGAHNGRTEQFALITLATIISDGMAKHISAHVKLRTRPPQRPAWPWPHTAHGGEMLPAVLGCERVTNKLSRRAHANTKLTTA